MLDDTEEELPSLTTLIPHPVFKKQKQMDPAGSASNPIKIDSDFAEAYLKLESSAPPPQVKIEPTDTTQSSISVRIEELSGEEPQQQSDDQQSDGDSVSPVPPKKPAPSKKPALPKKSVPSKKPVPPKKSAPSKKQPRAVKGAKKPKAIQSEASQSAKTETSQSGASVVTRSRARLPGQPEVPQVELPRTDRPWNLR